MKPGGAAAGWPLGVTAPRGPAAGGREALPGALPGVPGAVPGDRRDPGDRAGGPPGKAAEPGPREPGALAGVPIVPCKGEEMGCMLRRKQTEGMGRGSGQRSGSWAGTRRGGCAPCTTLQQTGLGAFDVRHCGCQSPPERELWLVSVLQDQRHQVWAQLLFLGTVPVQ